MLKVSLTKIVTFSELPHSRVPFQKMQGWVALCISCQLGTAPWFPLDVCVLITWISLTVSNPPHPLHLEMRGKICLFSHRARSYIFFEFRACLSLFMLLKFLNPALILSLIFTKLFASLINKQTDLQVLSMDDFSWIFAFQFRSQTFQSLARASLNSFG